MIPALALLIAAGTQVPAPARPAGASPEFNQTLDAIAAAINGGDYAKAERLLAHMPKETLVYKWDDSKVPATLRESYAKARNDAFSDWKGYMNRLKITEGPNPDVVFSFEPQLSINPETKTPLGLATFMSTAPGKPRIEAVLGLQRGKEKKAARPVEISNEVRYVVGRYLGLAEAPMFGPAVSRTDLSTNSRTLVTRQESSSATNVRNYVAHLTEKIAKKEKVEVTRPKAFTDTQSIDLGTIRQGDTVEVSVQLTNHGDGPLTFSILPDCGCLTTTPSGSVNAGTTKILKAAFDSSQFRGEVLKRLVVYTNDPDKSTFVIPVRAKIDPAYRFLKPDGEVVVAEGRKASAVVYLVVPEGSDLAPTSLRLDGIQGKVASEPWSGSLPDPVANEGPMPRKGYRILIDIDDVMPMGRAALTLTVATTHPAFPDLMYNLYLQKGIVALPTRVYLGELGKAPREVSFVLSRPGKPFKVKSIVPSLSSLTATYEPIEDGDLVVKVRYDGSGAKGDLMGSLKITTDDPVQPTLEVPVTGRVK